MSADMKEQIARVIDQKIERIQARSDKLYELDCDTTKERERNQGEIHSLLDLRAEILALLSAPQDREILEGKLASAILGEETWRLIAASESANVKQAYAEIERLRAGILERCERGPALDEFLYSAKARAAFTPPSVAVPDVGRCDHGVAFDHHCKKCDDHFFHPRQGNSRVVSPSVAVIPDGLRKALEEIATLDEYVTVDGEPVNAAFRRALDISRKALSAKPLKGQP